MLNFELITHEDIRQIHETTLRLLWEVGIRLTQPAARELLIDNGAVIRKDRVLFPPDLVMRCLDHCPPTVRLVGRDPTKAIVLGAGEQCSHNTGGIPNIFDPIDGSRRPACRQDNIHATRLAEMLPQVGVITTLFTPLDVPSEQMQFWSYYDVLLNTTKPVSGPGAQSAKEVQLFTEMASIVFPDSCLRDQTLAISTNSPLFFPDELVEAILEMARFGWTFAPLPAPTVGATAPMSIAGALVQQNAEVLGAIVLAQLVSPGLPVIYHGRLAVMDPRTGGSGWGGPELSLLSAGTVQLGHFYHLPVNVFGFCTDMTLPDIQSGYERTINALVPYCAGADQISGMGDMEGGLTSSLAQLVLDDEIMTSIKRVRRGFDVDQDSLALEVIRNVIDNKDENFFAEMHTVRYLRGGEVIIPRLARRQRWDEWEIAGRPDVLQLAAQKANELLSNYSAVPLSEEQARALVELEKVQGS